MSCRSVLLLAAVPFLMLAGCKEKAAAPTVQPSPSASLTPDRMVAPVLLTPDAKDVHSYADPAVARVTHVDLNLDADFEAKVLRGTATLDLQTAPDALKVVLDTRDLTIDKVTDGGDKLLLWNVGEKDEFHGAPMTVTLDGAKRVQITYSTSPNAAALQWLTPLQTAGKQQPFLFSQGEAILNRSWIPTQDSPGIRQTWDATITVPSALTAVMSAEGNIVDNKLVPGKPAGEGKHSYSFHMDKPVAPYLIALAVGDLAFQPTGPRTGIFAEPATLAKASAEFSDLEKFVDTAEGLYGPYRWGRYDLIVLPPSFPFGGMENPNLTFATPTAIAGDKSLVSLVAHELAHSWSGNLVTNATWDDFWLNEGFTSYFENRIMEKIYGKRRADMEADLAWSDMQEAIAQAGGLTAPDTQLHLTLAADRNPDDGMTQIAYDKGATFLRTIEAAVGRERFDAYLKGYFDRHAFQPQTSAGFVRDLRQYLIKDDKELADKLMVEQWVFQPGLPANAVHVKSDAFPAIDKAAAAYAKGGPVSAVPAKVSTQERVRFLDQLPRQIEQDRLARLDREFDFSTSGNSEIRFAWLQLALANRYPPAAASAQQFLTGQGRRKFVLPLFTEMMQQGPQSQALAKRIYAKARPGYHSVTTDSVDKVVGFTAEN